MRSKEVQIIPWVLEDSNFIKNPKQKLDPQKTVFVGALHGMLNADILQNQFVSVSRTGCIVCIYIAYTFNAVCD